MILTVLLFIPYQCGMLYGMFMLASFWASGSMWGIPDLLYLAFGLAAPMIGGFVSIFSAKFFFVVPGSLSFLYWWETREARQIVDGAADVRREERENALRMLAVDDKNAAAHWSLAQLAEAEKKYDEALSHYVKANALDARTVPPQELADIRDRIASSIELERHNPFLEEEARSNRRRERIENAFLYVGFGCLFLNWAYALNLCSMMLFLRWFSPFKRAGTLLS